MHYLCTAFQEEKLTGCSSVRLECLVWDQVVEGSNPFIPTKGRLICRPFVVRKDSRPPFILLRKSAPFHFAWRPYGTAVSFVASLAPIRFYLYFSISYALKHLTSFSVAMSICSLVWVAISENRISVSSGAQAGGMTGFTNTPSSNSIFVMKKVL